MIVFFFKWTIINNIKFQVNHVLYLFKRRKKRCKNQTNFQKKVLVVLLIQWSASAGKWSARVFHCEWVSLVRSRSCSGMDMFVSLCHRGVRTWGGGVKTLWATPGDFSSDSNSSPRVAMASRSSSSEHQATEPLPAAVLSLEKKRDALTGDRNNHLISF